MKKLAFTAALLAQVTAVANGFAAQNPGKLSLTVDGIEDGQPIPLKYAYCRPDKHGKTVNGSNISPNIYWSGAPQGTKSYALIVVDPDVPASFEDANKEGKTILTNFPRQKFYHWVLIDIPANVHGLLEGADSKGVTPGGKAFGKVGYGVNGQNDYAKVFSGPSGGYDGPCPPWNDDRRHHYHFVIYALDVPSLGLPNPVNGAQAESAMSGHILAKGEVMGTFSNSPRWLQK